MKIIEIDEELYKYITIHSQHIGESKSNILRRILNFYTINKHFPNIPLSKNKKKKSDRILKHYILRKFIVSENYIFQRKIVNKFITILSILYQLDDKSFDNAILYIKGRSRIYFSDDKKILLKHGIATKPKNIPITPYWVITNTNTSRKKIIIQKLMKGMFFSKKMIEHVCQTFMCHKN